MAKAPEKNDEAPKKVKRDVVGLASHAANLIAVYQFTHSYRGVADPLISRELTRAIDELDEALKDNG